ncbi:uncharacterized protein RSE6_14451 [Rhynchosporium secalis]|uniref:Uncharacterized protein n=1 Tax=Rhynchosporium secalis TaxID=38038 RepID=A0A1E1MVD7_RHYSE|nr:uncharacterized protein RSE6_14451 [Rhynchosporium secalis]
MPGSQPGPRRKDIKLCNHNKGIGRAEGVPDLGIDAPRNSACSKSAGILPESIYLSDPSSHSAGVSDWRVCESFLKGEITGAFKASKGRTRSPRMEGRIVHVE